MRELPSGTVTFLFTDIEGSTRLLQELGAAYTEALAEHRRVLREAFARHGGVEVDTQGDAFFVAFGRASDALGAAREVNDVLDGPIRVRIGIHTGSRSSPTKATSASMSIEPRGSRQSGTAGRSWSPSRRVIWSAPTGCATSDGIASKT